MSHVQGKNRSQTKIFNLDEAVDKEHIVRIIDAFVDILDLKEMGFLRVVATGPGRPPYHPAHLLKLYLYGYTQGIRSSRRLETLARESLPIMWLLDELRPDFKTIADFRKDNIGPITAVFDEYNSFLDSAGLFGKKVVAIDGTKIKASNNKKTNYSKKKIKARIEYNSARVKEYLDALDEADSEASYDKAEQALGDALSKVGKYEGYLAQLDATGQNEISEVDPDARLMGNNKNGVDVAYNIQTAVDDENHLVAAYDVSQNPTDHDQLFNMMQKTQDTLRRKDIVGLADKGYYNAEELGRCEEADMRTVVSRQKGPGDKDRDRCYRGDRFLYDPDKDIYTCPLGNILTTKSAPGAKQRGYSNKAACHACPEKKRCLTKKTRFRTIRRNTNSDIYDRADKLFEENAGLYKTRQQVVEHVYGTVKRSMDGNYFLLRTKEKVRCEASLMFLGYNIKRSISALGFDMLMEKLEEYAAIIRDHGVKEAAFLASSLFCPSGILRMLLPKRQQVNLT